MLRRSGGTDMEIVTSEAGKSFVSQGSGKTQLYSYEKPYGWRSYRRSMTRYRYANASSRQSLQVGRCPPTALAPLCRRHLLRNGYEPWRERLTPLATTGGSPRSLLERTSPRQLLSAT
ncbi:MAG: hypothetical protein KME23_22575 [Goleter apudmare HA4340-LM2]|nr:hypothetical protein [Goleter apudmare HA4340-LM2]